MMIATCTSATSVAARLRYAGAAALPFSVLAALIVAPLFVSGPVPHSSRRLLFILPRINSGDEPHYLLMVNSLLMDGDLDLANNYRRVHSGLDDAGRSFAGQLLDHHVSWYINGRCFLWPDIYEPSPVDWTRSGARFVPRPRTSAVAVPPSGPEYSWHAPGLAVFLAAFLYPVRHCGAIEPLCLALTAMITVVASAVFYYLARPYCPTDRTAWATVAITFLGTPVWHYARTLFTEPYILLAVLAAVATILRAQRYFAAGTAVACACLLKAPCAILLLPIAGYAALTRGTSAVAAVW
jgi:hypothetical protein